MTSSIAQDYIAGATMSVMSCFWFLVIWAMYRFERRGRS